MGYIFMVEVLSKSTESYDRGRKFSHYRTIQSSGSTCSYAGRPTIRTGRSNSIPSPAVCL